MLMRETTKIKYLALQARYKYLYEVKRYRHDDVVRTLRAEFYMGESRVMYVLGLVIG
jgi:hypothetical protein